MREGSWTRRTVLATGAGAFFATLAGCTGRSEVPPGGSSSSGGGPPDGSSVFEDISFDGGSMVVQLREGHDVSQVNLIAPDGTGVAQTEVPTGATTVRIKLLAIRQGNALHYSPGVHKLVAITDSDTVSIDLELRPNIQIIDVWRPRVVDGNDDYGRIELRISNTGTAPTWIYDIAYKQPPNISADTDLSSDPGILHLNGLESSEDAIIQPGTAKNYIGNHLPLVFPEKDDSECSNQTYIFSVLIGVATGEVLQKKIQATVAGEPKSVGVVGKYACSEVSVDHIEQDYTDEQA